MEEIRNYESMNVQEKWNLLSTVANLYYHSELTQNQIAERLFTSRSKVSRLLKEARELGIVKISIQEPWERNLEYENSLKERFALSKIRVVTVRDLEREDGFRKLTEAASYYLDSMIERDMVIGISWGNTLYRMIKYISANNRKNLPVTVVPIMGAANIKSPEKDAMDLSKDLASAYGGKYQYLYAPLFVNHKDLKESLIREEHIQEVLELSRHADMILTSVGSIVYRSWSDYLSVGTLEALGQRGAVGHIGGHFYDMQGRELETSLSDRMIGIRLEDIRRCREVFCVAYGAHKAEAVLGAMRGGFINTLIMDERCAERILELQDAGESLE